MNTGYDYKYELDEHGVLCQVNPDLFEYTDAYMDIYRNIGEEALRDMSKLRFKNIYDNIGYIPENLLDIGYGSGSFLKYAHEEWDVECFGNDICPYAMPKGTLFTKLDDTEYDVVTMFDTLEHFHDVSFLNVIRPEYLVITVPWLITEDWQSAAFQQWKHRKPNEHVRHFNVYSLKRFIESYGYHMVAISNVEDRIRQPDEECQHPNILTEIFKRIET